MSKEKAESVKQLKTKLNNGNLKQTSKISSKPKNDDVKKSKEIFKASSRSKNDDNKKSSESSTDRNNLKKSMPNTNNVPKSESKISLQSKMSNRTTASKIVSKSTDIKPVKSSISSTKSTTNISSKGTKSSSRDVTSKRVTKEQYFPKKFPFSSYLHENNDKMKESNQSLEQNTKTKQAPPKKLQRERTMTRILSPSEVKVIKNIIQEKTIDEINNRPRTAILHKHDTQILNSNDDSPNETILDESYNEYEDDFESYDSDFEMYSSSNSSIDDSVSIETNDSSANEGPIELTQRTNSAGNEEERKLDSGNYDLPELKHKQILDEIKEAIEKENSNLNDTVNNLASLSDEGFEDSSKHSLVNSGFVNFTDARKKQQQKRIHSKSRKRGVNLMGMIRLNNVTFTLFNMDAITYEDFMQSYGKTGTIQMSSQTGDDDLDEEIQTEHIDTISKSTQFPVTFSKTGESFQLDEHLIVENNKKINKKSLNKFLESATKLVLHIIEQKQSKTLHRAQKNERELIFSDGSFSLNFDNAPFLKNRVVKHIRCSKNSKLLTIHESNIQVHMNENNQLLSRATICIWDILEPTDPRYILASSSEINSSCFDSNHEYLVFAGLNDGSICVWDLREAKNVHRSVYDDINNTTHIMRSPTYSTVPIIDTEPNTTKIIAVKSYSTTINENINTTHNVSGIQVATLDETGVVIIWSVIEKQATQELLSEDQGIVPWGCIILVQGLVISLQKLNPNLKELQCVDLQFNEPDFNHFFIASNYGVLHCLTSGMKPKPKLYCTDKSVVNCIEMVPFLSSYFLSGCENGNIKLHSRSYEKSLMTLCSTEDQNNMAESIEIIKCLNNRPCVFFVKNKANIIHIWDLTKSDMYPIYSIPFSEDISDMNILPTLNFQSEEVQYLAIATKTHGVRIHIMNKDFAHLSPEQYKTELNIFLNYANRL